jgi:dephospho-CoA kinase
MKIIGITGPTGAGKSLFSESLVRHGISVIDADEVYHTLLIPPSPCLDALSSTFGTHILREDGTLDRQALAEIVFHDAEKLTLLNQTVLGFVLDEIRGQIRALAAKGETAVAIDAPTLIESGFDRECDTVVSVLAPAQERLNRIMARDHLSEEKAAARIASQPNDDFYREHSHAVLINDGDTNRFHREADALLTELLSLTGKEGL